MKPRTKVSSLLFAFLVAVAAPAFAADVPATPNRFAATIAPAERFEVQGMLVERHGSGAQAMILIPGLATGGWVWQDTVREFAGSHTLYVVTLPGFDGRPALEATPSGNPFDAAKGALKELIAARRLAKPVLVGHSLGATLAIALAEELPERVGGVVAIDGFAVMPRSEDVPPEGRAAMAESMRQRMAAATATPGAFAAQQQQYMRMAGTTDMGKADDLARLTSRSDPAAVAAYVGAVLALDLRPGLSKIRAPVLVLAASYGPDEEAMGVSTDAKLAYIRSLMAGTPKLEVAPVENARHFAMLDQPRAVHEALRRFLKTL